MPIEHVSDTARWVAVYRAMETERPDALFRDPYADRLAGPEGRRIVYELKQGRRMAWAMIVRTAVFDELILERIRAHGVDTVINLAAGLDTRAWRLDLPAMTEFKRDAMRGETPRCRYEAVAADLTSDAARDAVLRRLAGVATNALVVSEGLLVYLTEPQVTSLARALHAQPSIRWWLSDIASPLLLKFMARTWGKAVNEGNAPFRFGIDDRPAFFAPLGWREIAFRSMMDESRRLKREMRLNLFVRLMMKLQTARQRERIRVMSGCMLMERA